LVNNNKQERAGRIFFLRFEEVSDVMPIDYFLKNNTVILEYNATP